jgi:hypothetical protein
MAGYVSEWVERARVQRESQEDLIPTFVTGHRQSAKHSSLRLLINLLFSLARSTLLSHLTMTTPGQQQKSDYQLPNFFPLILPSCRDAANTFFECFEKDSMHAAACKPLQDSYEGCMNKAGIEKKLKLMRIPEQYRKKTEE